MKVKVISVEASSDDVYPLPLDNTIDGRKIVSFTPITGEERTGNIPEGELRKVDLTLRDINNTIIYDSVPLASFYDGKPENGKVTNVKSMIDNVSLQTSFFKVNTALSASFKIELLVFYV